jgi:DnaJ-class molecular chaperone
MGVSRDATAADIKRAYRGLARKYHPDVSKEENAEEQFKKVGEAYAVLKDPEKRAAYDQLGENWKAGQDFQAPPGWDAGFEYQGRGNDGVRWLFRVSCTKRTRIALRLQRDLDVNVAGVALALDLLDELQELRQTVRRSVLLGAEMED